MNWSSLSPNGHFIRAHEHKPNKWMATFIYVTIKMKYKAQMQMAISLIPISVIKMNMKLLLSGKQYKTTKLCYGSEVVDILKLQ